MLKNKKVDWNLFISAVTLSSVIISGILNYVLISKKESEAATNLSNIQIELARIDRKYKDVNNRLEFEKRRLVGVSDLLDLVSQMQPSLDLDDERSHEVKLYNNEVSIAVYLKNIGHFSTLISNPSIAISKTRLKKDLLEEGVDYEVLSSPSNYFLSKGETVGISWTLKLDPKHKSVYYRLKWVSSIDEVVLNSVEKFLEESFTQEQITKITTQTTTSRGRIVYETK